MIPFEVKIEVKGFRVVAALLSGVHGLGGLVQLGEDKPDPVLHRLHGGLIRGDERPARAIRPELLPAEQDQRVGGQDQLDGVLVPHLLEERVRHVRNQARVHDRRLLPPKRDRIHGGDAPRGAVPVILEDHLQFQVVEVGNEDALAGDFHHTLRPEVVEAAGHAGELEGHLPALWEAMAGGVFGYQCRGHGPGEVRVIRFWSEHRHGAIVGLADSDLLKFTVDVWCRVEARDTGCVEEVGSCCDDGARQG